MDQNLECGLVLIIFSNAFEELVINGFHYHEQQSLILNYQVSLSFLLFFFNLCIRCLRHCLQFFIFFCCVDLYAFFYDFACLLGRRSYALFI